jgi:signal transduction histidine kinase
MRRKLLGQLQDQLENIFSGIDQSSKDKTGPLSVETLGMKEPSSASGWLWECDSRGVLLWCSPEIEKFLGVPPEELIGQDVYTLGLTDESAERFKEAIQSQGAITNLPLEARNTEGARTKIVITALPRTSRTGERIGLRGVAQVQELLPSKSMVARRPQSPEKISVISPPDFTPTWGEPISYEVSGNQISPAAVEQLQIPATIQIENGKLVAPIRSGDETLGVIEFENESDEIHWGENEKELVEDVTQQLAATLQDARSYQLTRQALEEMREADQLKSQFLANMSHELRTPLNSIIGFSRVILKGIDGPINETQEKDLTSIYNAGQHLLGLINDILDLSKIEAGKMELAFTEVELDEIIRGVMATASGLIKDKPIELIVEVEENLPSIHADNIRIRQILLNLLSNAAKFTEGGEIGISARSLDTKEGNQVLIAVFDTGPGIELEEQGKLFEPFSQVDASLTRKTGGTGLGLSISRHLVELHGGRIWVESNPGQGSTFAFTLPIRPPSPEVDAEQASTTPAGQQVEPAVLLLQGKNRGLDFLHGFLNNQEFEVHLVDHLQDGEGSIDGAAQNILLVHLDEQSGNGWQELLDYRESNGTDDLGFVFFYFEGETKRGSVINIANFVTKSATTDSICEQLRALVDVDSPNFDILIVDDEVAAMHQMRSTLAANGYSGVRTAQRANAGLEEARASTPDLVLLNIFMDGNEGFVFLQAMSRDEALVGVPLVLLLPESMDEKQIALLQRYTFLLAKNGAKPPIEFLDELHAAINTRLQLSNS